MNYLSNHWRGHLPLAQSFWLNFIALAVLLFGIERYAFPPYWHASLALTGLVVVAITVIHAAITVWQVVGVLRCCDPAAAGINERTWIIPIQAVTIIGCAAIILSLLGFGQDLLIYQRVIKESQVSPVPKTYTLSLNQKATQIQLNGAIALGVSEAVKQLLKANPSVTGIVLDSGGGRVFEGRGLAQVIKQHQLNTYVFKHCLSACTTAFIGGNTRYLGTDGRLGFHRYKTYSTFPPIDVEAQQAKDSQLFARQGVNPEFIAKMFAYPAEQIWQPDSKQLLDAGVVHQQVKGSTINERE